jgi:hypothetical protein
MTLPIALPLPISRSLPALSLSLPALSLLIVCCTPRQSEQKAVPPPVAEVENDVPVPNDIASPWKVNGLTFVAPPEPFPADPFPPIKAVGANWIAVIPYAYTRIGTPSVRFGEGKWQWWGERPEGVRETIRMAKKEGVHVMLKPQVYIPGGWTGSMDYADATEWAKWEADYTRYILRFARLADSTGADLFCIGTEFGKSLEKRPQFWDGLIKEVKKAYKGKLTYSSNWDDWDRVPFWGQLDYIGMGGYFPLVDAVEPSVEDLKAAWKPILKRIKTYSAQQKRPVLFTEFGYLSVEGCGWRNWELENGIEQRRINEQAQANCLEALFSTFQPEPWWGGGFLWKWFPNMQGHEGYPERDYTPQSKRGEKVLQQYYSSRK